MRNKIYSPKISEDDVEKSKQHFEDLAKILARNYLDTSVGLTNEDASSEHEKENLYKILNKEVTSMPLSDSNGLKDWKRVIFLLGAGATYNAFNNVPLGDQAKKIIGDHFTFNLFEDFKYSFTDIMENKTIKDVVIKQLVKKGKDEKQIDEFINDESKKTHFEFSPALLNIIQKYKLEFAKLKIYNDNRLVSVEPDFENALLLLSHFFPASKIREELFAHFSFRHGPTLYFDLISHLFKHRFIDVIINFNFDELLDQAIEDEIGPNVYTSILSDGDIKDFADYIIDGKLKIPTYIKPHGTFSHKSSLRFTKNHYDLIPEDMQTFLTNLISCQGEDGYAKSSILVIFGFAMQSIEFDDILFSLDREKKTEIYFIAYSKSDANTIRKKYDRVIEAGKEENKGYELPFELKIIFAKSLVDFNTKEIQYDLFFEKLWEEINKFFDRKFEISPIHRHKIIQSIFGHRKLYGDLPSRDPSFDAPSPFRKVGKEMSLNKRYFESRYYFLDRCKIEIIIELLKRRGLISIQYLLKGKAGRYFKKYHEFVNNFNQKIDKKFNKEIVEMVKQKNDEKINQLSNEKNKQKIPVFSFLQILKSLELSPDYLKDKCSTEDFDATIASLKLSVGLSPDIESIKDTLHSYKEKLQGSTKAIIRSRFNDKRFLILDNYHPKQILHTRLAYEVEILKRVNKKWKAIVIVEDYNTIVDAFKLMADELLVLNCESCKELLSEHIDRGKLTNEAHNHHFVLFINEHEVDAIYYYQKGNSNMISPIVLTNNNNLLILLQVLRNYIKSSTLSKKGKSKWQSLIGKINLK